MRNLLSLAIAFMLILSFTAFASVETEFESEADYNPYLILVNKTRALPEAWDKIVHIDTVENSLGETLEIERKTYDAYCALRDELLGEGIQIELDSVYRSVEEQQEIWDAWLADPNKGEDYCKKYLAVPGYSEHHTGLAVDIFIIKDGEEIRENDDLFADMDDFVQIHNLLAKHGFILRYPKGKDYITGYSYEPWHFRYIDDPELAKQLTSQGLTLEEYLGEID